MKERLGEREIERKRRLGESGREIEEKRDWERDWERVTGRERLGDRWGSERPSNSTVPRAELS